MSSAPCCTSCWQAARRTLSSSGRGGALQAVCDVDPPRPSEVVGPLRRRLAGDLDNIVLKAMHKEPQRRYASAEQLAADVRRHLDGLPVLARPDTAFYRIEKFARRHRWGVGVAAAVLLLVLAFSVTVTHLWRRPFASATGRK